MSEDCTEIYGNFNLKPPYKDLYPIYWLVPPKSKVAYGVCGYSGKAFTFTTLNNFEGVLTIGIVVDLFITEGKCEEAERCLCLDCKYNKTTIGSYAKAKGLTTKRLSKVWEGLIAKVNGVVLNVSEVAEKMFLEEEKKRKGGGVSENKS